jgi:hypothetical protein
VRPKNLRILRIRIRNTDQKYDRFSSTVVEGSFLVCIFYKFIAFARISILNVRILRECMLNSGSSQSELRKILTFFSVIFTLKKKKRKKERFS